MRRCPGLEEGRAVALPLEKLGTEIYEAGASMTPTVEGATVYVFEGSGKGAAVAKNGLAEVV